MQIKQEPTLFDVNGRDLPDEEIKRPTSLTFADGVTTTTAYSSLSSSGVPITTPSNLIGGGCHEFCLKYFFFFEFRIIHQKIIRIIVWLETKKKDKKERF